MHGKRRELLAAIGVLALAVAVRVAWLLLVPNEQWSDVKWYDDAARHLARHGELRFVGPAGTYRAWFPPGWPFFLGAVYWLVGEHSWTLKGTNLVLSLATVWLTIRAGSAIFGASAALVGGLLLSVLPGQVAYVGLAQYEV